MKVGEGRPDTGELTAAAQAAAALASAGVPLSAGPAPVLGGPSLVVTKADVALAVKTEELKNAVERFRETPEEKKAKLERERLRKKLDDQEDRELRAREATLRKDYEDAQAQAVAAMV